jgi:hypothetical protein
MSRSKTDKTSSVMTVRVPTTLKIDIDKRLAAEQISIQDLLFTFLERWVKEGTAGTSFATPKLAIDFATHGSSILGEAKFSGQAQPQLSQEDLAHIRKLLAKLNQPDAPQKTRTPRKRSS